ncbi:ATP-dependent DNA helicase, partial [Frankliniella fusca]
MKIKKQFNAFSDEVIQKAVNKAFERNEENPVLFDKEQACFDFDNYHFPSALALLGLEDNFVQMDIQLELDDSHKTSEMKFTSPNKRSEMEFQNMFEKLNQEQRNFFFKSRTFPSVPTRKSLINAVHLFAKNEHLFENNSHFGGISVITVGDFYQSKPVFARALYAQNSDNPYQEIFHKPLWHRFKVFKLTQIMRQNCIRKLYSKDIEFFKSRTFPSVPTRKSLINAVHLFAKNEDVDKFNKKASSNLKGKHYKAIASDVIRGSGSQLAKRQLLHCLHNSRHQDTMGIPSEILLKVNGKYMLSYNIDIDGGLCNGATATLKQIDFGRNTDGKKKPLRLWMEFDDIKTGQILRKKSESSTKLDTYLTHSIDCENSKLKVNRKQFPILVAHAISIIKSQGLSLSK